MSTAGSVPDAPDGAPPPPAPLKKRPPFFRWRGVIPLVVAFALVAAWWMVFGERVVRTSIEDASTQALGTHVDVGRVTIDVRGATLEMRGLQVADPSDRMRNLIEIAGARLVVDVEALLEKKIVIRDASMSGVRISTRRRSPAPPATPDGLIPRALREAEAFTAQFKVPLLSLTPVDTIKSLILDPRQLQTVRAVEAVVTRGDSVRRDITSRIESLRLRSIADSTEALVTSLKGKTPRTLGLIGTRNAVNDVRRLVARVDSVKRAIDALQRSTRTAVDSVLSSVRELDEARKNDYAFARGLLELPTIDAPTIGPALFGDVSLDVMERAMYWVSLARDYAPPGLLPRESPGPKRLRKSGTTVRFIQPASFPRFHLQRGSVALSLDSTAGAGRGEYALTVRDVTSDPALVGQATAFSLQRSAGGSAIESLTVDGTVDHRGARAQETMDLRASGVRLPSFAIPALPLSVDLGRGTTRFLLRVVGDSIDARWTTAATRATWRRDTTAAPSRRSARGVIEDLVSRVIMGIDRIDIEADVRGTLRSPSLAVKSNLDRAVAENLKRVAGEEVARAEARVRAQVDSISAEIVASMRAKTGEVRADVDARIREVVKRVDRLKADLAAQLRALALPIEESAGRAPGLASWSRPD
jgi:uncharacterized protein (TIGR03545 family)